MNIRKLFDSSVSYYNEEQADRTGKILPRQFPLEAESPADGVWRGGVCKDGDAGSSLQTSRLGTLRHGRHLTLQSKILSLQVHLRIN